MKKVNSAIIIDDDPTNNLVCENIIIGSRLTDNVKSFTNVSEALNYLKALQNKEELPDIIFLDINLPQMSGWDFLEEYKALIAKNIKKPDLFILTSSIIKKDIVKAKSEQEVKGFINKPLTKEKVKTLFQL